MTKNRLGFIFFCLEWIIIGTVSSYDAYLTIKYRDFLQDCEENPIARWILKSTDWDVSLFIGLKMAGTIITLGILSLIYTFNKKKAYIISFCITVAQIVLLLYLEGFI